MDWSTLITLAAIGLMFFLMMRHGGGCCGGGHSKPQDKLKEMTKSNES